MPVQNQRGDLRRRPRLSIGEVTPKSYITGRVQTYLSILITATQPRATLDSYKLNMTSNNGVRSFPKIKEVRTFLTQGVGSGGDYHNVSGGHWLIDSKISTPMSGYEKYRKSRTSFGINVLGSFCVEVEGTDGSKGFATGFGGPPACWLVHEHFERFLVGAGE